jgi:hypothetical protein
MIFPESYMPLVEIADAFISDNKRMHFVQGEPELANSKKEYESWADHSGFFEGVQSVWGFCDDEANLPYTMLENGTIVRISQKILRNWGVDPIGTFVEVNIGTIGSGSGHYSWRAHLDAEGKRSKKLLEKHLGPFCGLPVLYKEKSARKYLDRLGNWEGSPKAPNHNSIARAIVAEFENDRRLTKSEAKARFAPKMKQAEFIATWEIAAAMRPELSKPGPKRPK